MGPAHGIIHGLSPAELPRHDRRPAQNHPRHQRAALRERRPAPRSHRRVRADGHLGALPADARPRLPVHLGQRRARHADHAQGAPGRHHARAADRADRRRAAARLRRVRHLVRQLPHHALGRESRAHLRDLPPAVGRRPHPARDDRAGVRRAGEDVPARSLRARHLPEVRRARPVRRQLRSLRRHLYAGRSARSGLGRERHRARAARVRAPVLQARRLRADAARMDRLRAAAAGGDLQARRMVRRRAARLGHFARRALLRIRDSRRERQVFLRLARRADRVPVEPAAVLPPHGPRFRPLLESGQRRRGVPLHRQGHRLFPHAVLARGARRRRLPAADVGLRARLSHGQRPEDVEVARHADHGARLARSPARRVPQVLLRVAARQRGRGPRPQPRRLHGQGEFGRRRQAGEHREPLRRLHHARLRRSACRSPRRARAAGRIRSRRRAHRRALRGTRPRGSRARDHGA